jgi:hypothetical protein
MSVLEKFRSAVDSVRQQGAGPALGQAHVPLLALMPSSSPAAADRLRAGDEA